MVLFNFFFLDVCFLMRARKDVSEGRCEGREDLGGFEGEGTIIRIYCKKKKRKKTIFNKCFNKT